MSKRIKNENCHLQAECERKCEHIGSEENCDYYKNNNVDQGHWRDVLEGPPYTDDRNEYDVEYEAEDEAEQEHTEAKLVYISVDKLHPHPDNPRKDLGDLSELADSIKAKGVMQNLTVVPRSEGGYTVIIGHRRMGAAKLAGLTELPCVIVEMSEQEQIATMLLENMQRSDLTIYEQAQGFQMMFDFGESVESISEKTGFSKSTVRRRLKMNELDADKLKKASSRQITLDDFDRLSKIDDIDKRNELLDVLGTSNFEYSYKQALSRQEEEKHCEIWRTAMLARGMTELDYNDVFGNSEYRSSNRPYAACSACSPDDFPFEEDMQYFAFNRGTAYFRRKRNSEDDEKQAEWQRKQDKAREIKDALDDITKRAYELRRDFVENITEATAKKLAPIVIEYNVQKDWSQIDNYGWNNGYRTEKFPNRLPDAHGIDAIYPQIQETPFRTFLLHTYIRWSDGENCGYANYIGQWVENKRLNFIYDFLEKLGYEVSDEERSMMDGTNALFGGDDDEDEIIEMKVSLDEETADEEDLSEDDFDEMIREKLKGVIEDE